MAGLLNATGVRKRPARRPAASLLSSASFGPAIVIAQQRAADVGIRVRANVPAGGVVRVEGRVDAVPLRCRQRACRGGEDEGESNRGLGQHGRVSFLMTEPFGQALT